MRDKPTIRPIAEQLLRKYETQESWLAHDSLVHGVDHMARVLILQELLCDELEAQNIPVDREALRWAASTHDVGRVDDGIDPNHGRRSAEWIRYNLSEKMSHRLLETVSYIVRWHVPSDDKAPVMTTELQVLKDADALDRVRINDFDTRFLRTDAARALVAVAEAMFRAYENIDGPDAFENVIQAGQQIGVVGAG